MATAQTSHATIYRIYFRFHMLCRNKGVCIETYEKHADHLWQQICFILTPNLARVTFSDKLHYVYYFFIQLWLWNNQIQRRMVSEISSPCPSAYLKTVFFSPVAINWELYEINSWKKTMKRSPWINWAASWQNQQNDSALSEDSDQPGHPTSLIRVFAVRLMGS